ncbi:MAG TPA: PHB depolymerase family esterase [Hyphomicrobiaceae bacterium]
MRGVLRGAMCALAAATVLANSPVRADAIRIETKDGPRSAILVPAGPDPAPTIIVLHGAAIGAEWTMRGSGFAEAAAAHGFAAVFPDGIYRVWNDGREGGRISGIDDVGFLRRLVAWLIGHGVADPARVYLAGVSNGGMMTFRMLCEAAELFAGAGTIIANMPAGIGDGCRPKKPLPIVMLNGTADPLVPYGGGGVGFAGRRGIVWSAERTAAFLAEGNGCNGPATRPLATSASGEATKVVRLDWSSCSSGRPVTLYRIEGGGHQLFGRADIFPAILGPGTRLISASEVMLELFAGTGR